MGAVPLDSCRDDAEADVLAHDAARAPSNGKGWLPKPSFGTSCPAALRSAILSLTRRSQQAMHRTISVRLAR